jgi:hypothetical protein
MDRKAMTPDDGAATSARDDFSDFDAGYRFGQSGHADDDFSASDFAPPEPEAPTTEGPLAPPFPLGGVDLLSPPGFVGDVAAWIDSQCRYPRRRLAVASAIVTVGNAGGLRHEDEVDDVTANMLAFCVAASATGKEAVQQAMAELHRAAGIHYALQGGIKSEQEIMRNLIEHQAAYYIVDEIGIFLGKVRNAQRRGGAAYLEGVFGAIMSAYSKAGSRLILGGDTKRELAKVYGSALAKAQDDGADQDHIARLSRMQAMVDDGLERPFLSLVGYTTPGTFDGIMDGEAATQGFVGRSLIITEPDFNPRARAGFRKRPLPMHLAMRLAQLFSGGQVDMGQGRVRIEYAGAREVVRTDDDARAMLVQVSDWLHAYADEMEQHTGEASVALIRRSYEMIAKVSFILALPTGLRTAEHVRWAFAYVRAELDAKIKLVFANDNAKNRPDEAMAARILNAIDPDKGSSAKVLANRMKVKLDVIEGLLGRMEVAGQVRRVSTGRTYKGQPVNVWLLSEA